MSNKQKIEKRMTFKSPIDKVWQAITSPKSISQWFGDKAEFELVENSIGHFGWKEHGLFAMRIEKITPKGYFSWRWMAEKSVAFNKEQSTLVEWQLSENKLGGTDLVLTESGFRTEKSREENVNGWKEELADLASFLNI